MRDTARTGRYRLWEYYREALRVGKVEHEDGGI